MFDSISKCFNNNSETIFLLNCTIVGFTFFLKSMSEKKVLFLSYNLFFGNLPDNIGNLQNLEYFYGIF